MYNEPTHAHWLKMKQIKLSFFLVWCGEISGECLNEPSLASSCSSAFESHTEIHLLLQLHKPELNATVAVNTGNITHSPLNLPLLFFLSCHLSVPS